MDVNCYQFIWYILKFVRQALCLSLINEFLIAAIFQIEWCVQWAVAKCLDCPCLLASFIILSAMCDLCSVGTFSELDEVKNPASSADFIQQHPLSIQFAHLFSFPLLYRYAYSDDGSGEFDKDETTLTLIRPSPLPSKDVRKVPEAIPVQGNNGLSNGDLEEDKTE